MLSLLFVALTLNLEAISAFSYYDGPLSHSDAKAFCERGGSHLATIVSDADRMEALSVIPGTSPWIGLEHEEPGPHNFKCHFTYPEDIDYPNVCPLYPDGWKCANLWHEGGPIKLDEGGSECVVFHHDFDGRSGIFYNNFPCDTPRPFLCEENPGSYNGEYTCVRQFFYEYSGAEQACKDVFGTDLATILTEDDLTAAYTAMDAVGAVAAWIGLTDRDIEGKYKWVDGTPCINTEDSCTQFWRPGEPDDLSDAPKNDPTTPNADCGFLWPYYPDTDEYIVHQTCSTEDSSGAHAYCCNAGVVNRRRMVEQFDDDMSIDGV